MPNWCLNKLWVSGPPDEVDKFLAASGDVPLSFKKLYPMPQDNDEARDGIGKEVDHLLGFQAKLSGLSDGELTPEVRKELLEKQKKSSSPNTHWYMWQLSNWGTKWDVDNPSIVLEQEISGVKIVVVDFCTAWSPPCEAFNNISPNFPALTFVLDYEEPGMAFQGKGLWEHGDLLLDKSWEWEDPWGQEEEAV